MSRLREEQGIALVPAIGVMLIVLLVGAAVLSTVNSQTSQSGAERAQEGSFQVAEGALNSQTVQLSRAWPASLAKAYPTCTQGTTPSATCSGTTLTATYTASAGGSGPVAGSDFTSTPVWTTRVIDDVNGSDYYDESLATSGAAAYDSNANGSVWVRAEAEVGGERSIVVSLVKQGEPVLEELPSASIIAGWFQTTNNGKKVIVDAIGNSATAGTVSVRCNTGPARNDACLGYDPGKGQLSPADAYEKNYVDGTGTPNATNRRILDDAALERLKERAISLGTYYATGCPPTLTGALIYVENPTNANCSYTSNTNWNSPTSAGVIIFGGGQLSIGGTSAFYGLIYNANRQGTAPASGPCTAEHMNPVVNLSGATEIHGAVLVDHCGGVIAGSNKVNISFDANVFANVVSNGIAGNVENTFRIVPNY